MASAARNLVFDSCSYVDLAGLRMKKTIPGNDKLAPLEFVDASVFESANREEQEVCNFVLALALAYNDLNDLRWAFTAAVDTCPARMEITPQAGRSNGIREHCIRLLYALHHELLLLIQKNPKPQTHFLFTNVLNRIGKSQLGNWKTLVAAADGKPKDDPVAMMLVRVRDDIASHYYGMDLLARGFRRQYDGSSQSFKRNLFVSRGASLFTSRFHFADGAAQGALQYLSEEKIKENISDRLGTVSNSAASALFSIVTRFMEDRAKGWQKYRA